MGALQKSRGVRRRAEPQNSRDKKEMTASTLQTRKRWQSQCSRQEGETHCTVRRKLGIWFFKKTLRRLLYILWLWCILFLYLSHKRFNETLLFTLLNITLLDNHSRRSRFLLSRTHNRLKYLRDCRPFLSALPHLNASSEIRVACHAVVDNSSREKTRKVTIDLLCLNCQTSQRTSQPVRPKTRMIFRRSACRYGS